MWTCSTYTSAYINHEHRCDCPAHLFGMTPWDFLPQFSWVKSHPIHPDFLCNRCFEKHGQEWCKFDLEWALFKERLEVADKNMADSKLDAQVIFDGLVAFSLGQMKGWFETGQDHSSGWQSKKEHLCGDGCDKGVYLSELHEKPKASRQLNKSTLGAILQYQSAFSIEKQCGKCHMYPHMQTVTQFWHIMVVAKGFEGTCCNSNATMLPLPCGRSWVSQVSGTTECLGGTQMVCHWCTSPCTIPSSLPWPQLLKGLEDKKTPENPARWCRDCV